MSHIKMSQNYLIVTDNSVHCRFTWWAVCLIMWVYGKNTTLLCWCFNSLLNSKCIDLLQQIESCCSN